MKGPNYKACYMVHQESHRLPACNFSGISDDEFNHKKKLPHPFDESIVLVIDLNITANL